ncbi:MAG TPA: ComEA family DNA-binding protein [Jatrophihabitantaceae bacterium]
MGAAEHGGRGRRTGGPGRPGRGERARVASRVRALVDTGGGGSEPAGSGVAGRPAASWLPAAEPNPPRFGPERRGGGPAERGGRARLRWDPGRRGAVALGGLLVVAIAATGWWLAASRPREVPISGPSAAAPGVTAPFSASGVAPTGRSATGSAPAASAGGSGAAASGDAPLVVDVAGKVRHPGLYRLPSGARVNDALKAAGGARKGVSTLSLNLAESLHDGEQIVVGAPGGTGGGVSGGSTASASAASSPAPAIVDLNTATLDQLETLPGVGPVLGQHILDWRDAHGRFASVDQLREVSGIGDVRMAQLRALVSV